MQEVWSAVDEYYEQQLVAEPGDLKQVAENSIKARLFPIAVSANQGKFLHMLVLMTRAKRVLEIGTLGGYSAVWMAKALPDDGKLITLEKNPYFTKIARKNISELEDVRDKIEIIEGLALDTMARLKQENVEAFDLIFIDANKADNLKYFEAALELSKPGTLIIADNVVRAGEILDNSDTNSNAEAIAGIKAMNERIAKEPRVTACTLQMVGVKGYDGMSFVIVTD